VPVTLCDPIQHVSSHSSEACCKLLYSIYFHLYLFGLTQVNTQIAPRSVPAIFVGLTLVTNRQTDHATCVATVCISCYAVQCGLITHIIVSSAVAVIFCVECHFSWLSCGLETVSNAGGQLQATSQFLQHATFTDDAAKD